MRTLVVRLGAIVVAITATLTAAGSDLASRVTQLTRATERTRRSAIAIPFKTHHPQGLVKIGDRLFLSSVEVIDRDAGKGVGHLFQVDLSGKLIAELKLGEGAIYHPGGLDYDGRHIWVAVAEYRPNSQSIVYRIDPQTMTATEMFRFHDHLGALVHDTETHSLHGVSWGSRVFYRWALSRDGRVKNAAQPVRIANASHYIDYQDCKFAGQRRMLCTGVAEFRVTPGSEPFRLGGIDLVSLRDHRPIHQAPLLLWVRGLDLAHNPVWLEPTASGLRGYFVPEDDDSTLYVYETK
ncbi:MAG: DUF6454 family protein [Vicinamibacterales bacterium]